MSRGLNKSQFEDLLSFVGVTKMNQWKGDSMQFCCPIHGENNPSCGVNLDFTPEDSGESVQIFHCFSCGESGTIPWFVYRSLPDQFSSMRQAEEFLVDRYNIEYTFALTSKDLKLAKYESAYLIQLKDRFELPRTTLAPYMSGEETYKYFFDRGFDVEDMKKFKIGRDLVNETVTIPAFWEDKVLAGVIGRYIDPSRPKNMRFKIYKFPKGELIYPLDKLEVIDGTIIGVESMFDAMMLHKWGFTNAVAIMGDSMTKAQANMIANRCTKFIDLFDNDSGGQTARKIAKKRLDKRVLYLTCEYPEEGKDPCDWGENITKQVISTASFVETRKLPRM